MPDILSGEHADILPCMTSDLKCERRWSGGGGERFADLTEKKETLSK